MVVFPFSFSSALDARLAGLKAIGYRYEARSWLLHRALPLPQGGHEIERYWHLACASTGQTAAALPRQLRLPLTDAARSEAQERLRAAGLASDYLVLCPFAGGADCRDKTGTGHISRRSRSNFGRKATHWSCARGRTNSNRHGGILPTRTSWKACPCRYMQPSSPAPA